MTIQANFTFDNIAYSFKRPLAMLDRNYNDEDYAYFLERIPNTEDGLFEINILKNEVDGELRAAGYTSIYLCSDQVMPDKIVDTVINLI